MNTDGYTLLTDVAHRNDILVGTLSMLRRRHSRGIKIGRDWWLSDDDIKFLLSRIGQGGKRLT